MSTDSDQALASDSDQVQWVTIGDSDKEQMVMSADSDQVQAADRDQVQ